MDVFSFMAGLCILFVEYPSAPAANSAIDSLETTCPDRPIRRLRKRVDGFRGNPVVFIKMAQRTGRAVVMEEPARRCSNPERIIVLGVYRRDAIPRKLPADFDHISKMAALEHVDAIRCSSQKIAVLVTDNRPDFVAFQALVR